MKRISWKIEDRLISETKYIKHVSRRAIAFKNEDNLTGRIEINTEVIILKGGGLVLPYFKSSRDNRWKIVLVDQYRPAILKRTLEAPGGRLDGEPPKTALARELAEEAAIKVRPESIKLVVNEYTHPSILSSSNIGGIVEVNQGSVKNKVRAGKKCEKEWTRVEVFDVIEIIKKREANTIKLDLMTSRLIDEVAKIVGLLIKKY